MKREIVFFTAVFLTLITSIFSRPNIKYIDFKVLVCLFNLMVLSAAFEKIKILDFIALKILSKSNGKRKVSFIIIGLTFFSSMFLTNDVALLTFVPITLIIASKAAFNPIEILISAFLSQIISNVPSSILMAGFTHSWKALLLGVDIGGMGTLIASLASVITYKFYAKHYNGGRYLFKFHIYNFLMLGIFLTLAYILI
jgi:Na+/H+ antiporter NhaD/arsenite permease-like protein